MIITLIIDANAANVQRLRKLLTNHCPDIEVAGTAGNLLLAREKILALQPQLVFFDIKMPEGNAFGLLDNLLPADFEIIFITGQTNHAIDAIKYSPVDYLLHPVKVKELKWAVQKAAERIRLKSIHRKLDSLFNNLKTARLSLDKIALPTIDGLLFVDIKEVMWLEGSGNYTRVHLESGEKIMISRHLKEFEDALPANSFSRIHQSYIINHNYIRKYNRGRGGSIEMADGTMIEVSLRKKDEFLGKFK